MTEQWDCNYDNLVGQFEKDNQNFSENTVSAYLTAIRQFFNYCKLDLMKIKNNDILGWQDHLTKSGYKPSSRLLKFAALKAFFSYCLDSGIIESDPTIYFEKPSVDDFIENYIDSKELFLLREAAKGNLRDLAIIETLFATGVRVTELININVEDIKWASRRIYISKAKRSIDGYVFFSLRCEERLKRYLQSRKTGYLFVNKFGQPFTRQGIWKLLKKYSMAAGIQKKVSPHTLRHSLATHLANKGVQHALISFQLNHVNESSAQGYIFRSRKTRKRLFEQFYHS